MGGEININGVPDTTLQRKQLTPPPPPPEVKPPEPTPAPPEPKAVNPLETASPGSATAKPSNQAEELPVPSPKANKASDQAWGAMGATALSNSGPKAVPGSENTIDTDAERAHSDLKRTVTELGIRQALESNGAPKDQLDSLTKSVVDKMFRGEGETPGGNVGFALAKDGGIVHKGADGKDYYEFGIGGEGSSLDLNGDGKNDSSRQYFKVDKALVDGLSASTTPVTEADESAKPKSPVADTKPGLVPSSSELEKIADAGIKKLQQLTEGVLGKNLSEFTALLAGAAADSAIGKYGPLLDLAKPGLEAGVKKAEELARALSSTAQLGETSLNPKVNLSQAESKALREVLNDFSPVDDKDAYSKIAKLALNESVKFRLTASKFGESFLNVHNVNNERYLEYGFDNIAGKLGEGLDNQNLYVLNNIGLYYEDGSSAAKATPVKEVSLNEVEDYEPSFMRFANNIYMSKSDNPILFSNSTPLKPNDEGVFNLAIRSGGQITLTGISPVIDQGNLKFKIINSKLRLVE